MNNLSLLKVSIALAFACTASLAQAQQVNATTGVSQPERAWRYKTPKLDRAQIDLLLQKPEQIVVVDVRRPDELTKIGGFPVYLSIQAGELEKSLSYIPKDRKILTASNHAGRAGAAGDLLSAKGYKVAGAVGVQNYEEEGGKLARVLPPSAAVSASAPVAR